MRLAGEADRQARAGQRRDSETIRKHRPREQSTPERERQVQVSAGHLTARKRQASRRELGALGRNRKLEPQSAGVAELCTGLPEGAKGLHGLAEPNQQAEEHAKFADDKLAKQLHISE